MAAAALCGVDASRLMRVTDPAEALLLEAVVERAVEIDGERRQDLASRIITTLAEALKKGR